MALRDLHALTAGSSCLQRIPWHGSSCPTVSGGLLWDATTAF